MPTGRLPSLACKNPAKAADPACIARKSSEICERYTLGNQSAAGRGAAFFVGGWPSDDPSLGSILRHQRGFSQLLGIANFGNRFRVIRKIGLWAEKTLLLRYPLGYIKGAGVG